MIDDLLFPGATLRAIVLRSVLVSGAATALAVLLGVPVGYMIARRTFPGRAPRRGRCGVPLQAPGRITQIAVADDVVPIEHAAILVATQLHRHSLWDARSYHVSDRCSPEVMRDAARTSSLDSGAAPSVVDPLGDIACPARNATSPAFVVPS
jgi:hypothetical protein